MLLRDYRSTDLETIHRINQGEVPAVGTETIDHLGEIAEQSTIALVGEVDDTIAGFCLVLAPDAAYDSVNYLWFSERYDDFIYLDRVAFPSEYQGRGFGRAMYTEVERLAAGRRPTASHLALEVNLRPRNEQSLAFHARLGFEHVGQQETDYGALVSLMAKPL